MTYCKHKPVFCECQPDEGMPCPHAPAEPPAAVILRDLDSLETTTSGEYRRVVGLMARALIERQAREIAELRAERDTFAEDNRRHTDATNRMMDDLVSLRECLSELVACADEYDQIVSARLYGKPHLPEHKARELDHRRRKIEAWRAARAKVKP